MQNDFFVPVVLPQLQCHSLKLACKHGEHLPNNWYCEWYLHSLSLSLSLFRPLWQFSSQVWFLQRNFFPHTKRHICSPATSTEWLIWTHWFDMNSLIWCELLQQHTQFHTQISLTNAHTLLTLFVFEWRTTSLIASMTPTAFQSTAALMAQNGAHMWKWWGRHVSSAAFIKIFTF